MTWDVGSIKPLFCIVDGHYMINPTVNLSKFEMSNNIAHTYNVSKMANMCFWEELAYRDPLVENGPIWAL